MAAKKIIAEFKLMQDQFRDDKTAQAIARNADALYQPDDYQKNVVQGALVLSRSGLGCFEYMTQWSSGKTLWGYGDATITVSADGELG